MSAPIPAPIQVVAKLEITFNVNGEVGVSGNIDNKALCYSMLEIAKDAIRDHHRKLQEGLKVALPASADVLKFGHQGT